MGVVLGNMKGTNKVTLDANGFKIKSTEMNNNFNSIFSSGNSSLFTTTSSGVIKTDKPLRFSFQPFVTGFYNLSSNYTVNTPDSTGLFNINFGFKFNNNSSILATWKPYIFNIDGGSEQIKLTFIYNPFTKETTLEIYTIDSSYAPGGNTTTVNLGSDKNFNIKLVYFYDALFVCRFKTPDTLELLSYTEIYLSNECNIIIRGEAGSTDAPGSVLIKDLYYLPVISTDSTITGGITSSAIVMNYRNGEYTAACKFNMPGKFNLALIQPWPAYNIAQTPDTLELEVLPSNSRRGSEKFLISDLQRLYTDAAPLLACPIRGVQDNTNKGNIQIYNRCFNDGSERNGDTMNLVLDKFGQFNSLGDRAKNPEFFIKEDNIELGCNFDFQRVHHYLDSLEVVSDMNHHIGTMKSLELSSGNILYYGFVGYTCSDKDINIDLVFNWSADQLATPGSDIDIFDWSLEYEDGTVIDYQTDVKYSNYLSKLPDPVYNIQCPRVRLIIYNNSGGDGASVDAQVFDDGNLIAVGRAEAANLGVAYDPDFTKNKERGVCIINFDISTNNGHIVSFLHDICDNTIIKYQDTGDYANIAKESISAFELDNGDVVYVFIGRDILLSYIADRRKKISYKKMNINTGIRGTYDSLTYDIFLPNGLMVNNFIHCFDAVKKGNLVYFYISTVSADKYVQETKTSEGITKTSKRNVPFTPFGIRGIVCLGFDIDGWDFEDKSYTVINYTTANIVLTGVEEFCRIGQADLFFFAGKTEDGQFWRKYAMLDSISAVYDKYTDRTVLACIETNTRLPVVLMGNDLTFKEIAIPPHFNIFEKTKGRGMPLKNLVDSFYTNFGIDSFSACYSSDGMVYTIASKRDVKELGLVDPSFYWSSEMEVATAQTNSQYRAKVFQPEFRFENYPFMSTGIYKEPHENYPAVPVYNSHVNINNIQSRLTICMSSKNLTKIPNIFVNGVYDQAPFETINQLVWLPELTTHQQNFNTFGGTFLKDKYFQVRNQMSVISIIQGSLTSVNTIRNEHWKLHVGYKFHARIKCLPNSLVFTEPLFFYASGITNLESPFIGCDCRFRIMASYAQAQYYDNATLSWRQVGDNIPLSGGTYDYYILMQKNGDDTSNKGSVAFFVKEFIHQKDLSSSSEATYNYRNNNLFSETVFNVSLNTTVTIEESFFGVFFSANDLVDRNEYARIYELGFNLLKADIGNFVPFTNTKPSLSTFTDYRAEPRIGRRWRNFDDTIMFAYNNSPNYKFKTYIVSGASTSSRYHWYNGFSFCLTGERSFNLDKISLKREEIANINNILSKNLYGDFKSKDTTQNITIWADSVDSGFEKFMVDLVVLTGINFDRFTIVGKNDIGDLWTTIKSCDTYKYQGNFDLENDGALFKLKKENYNIPVGSLLNYQHYTYNPNYGVSKIKDCSNNYIISYSFNGYPYSSFYKIFTSRVAIKLDDLASYRYIGIRTNSTSTYDGYFKLSCLDFGKSTDMVASYTLDIGFNSIKNVDSDVQTVYNNQALNFESSMDYFSYQLSYSVTSAKTYLTLLSMADKIANNAKPVWFVPDIENDRFEFDLTFIDGQISHETLVDDVLSSGEIKKLYKITLSLKGVPR